MEGTQIGAYRIERQLGRGGFGVVWVGVDVRLGRRAAIKQLLPELSQRHDVVERFFNEARAAANINHPGIVEIYEVGWHTDGSAYFAMKLLEGDSLARRLRDRGMLPIPVATTIARQVASALSAAHQRGIVHRDLKPDNIVLVPDEEVAIGERATVLDFGIAKLVSDAPASQRTATGMMLGTPAYMSPEQCRGAGEVDHRTDIYALGCILFEMIAGRPPFVGEGAGETLGMHQFVETPKVSEFRPDIPPELETIIMRALAKKPEQRYPQMSDLAAAFQPFTSATRAQNVVAPSPTPVDPRAATVEASQISDLSKYARPANKPPITNQTTMSTGAAQVVPPPMTPRKPRALLFVIAVVLLAAAAAISFAVVSQSDPEQEVVATGPSAASGSDPSERPVVADAAAAVELAADAIAIDAHVASAPPDAATKRPRPPNPSPPPPKETLADKVRIECQAHETARSWASLMTCSVQLELLDRPAATEFRKRATLEGAAEGNSTKLKEAIARGNLAAARNLLAQIPKASVYFKDAEAALKEAEANAPPPPPSDKPKCDAEPAKAAFGDHKYQEAIKLFEAILHCAPDKQKVIGNIFIAACRSKNVKKAKAYYSQLAASQERLVQHCLGEGIDPRPAAGSASAD